MKTKIPDAPHAPSEGRTRSVSPLKFHPEGQRTQVLQREIPMAWGTITDSLTPRINPFQYAIEIKYLTLKDQTSYLIPDG